MLYEVITCLLLLPLTALGADKPQTYVIKKGDTLWGISEKFLKDPDYWPSLWSNKPFIRNPHLIYPGQKIAIRVITSYSIHYTKLYDST